MMVFFVGSSERFTSFLAQTEEAQAHQSGYDMIKDRALWSKP
jgi:hypothetical protein